MAFAVGTSQASHITISPVWSSVPCTATSGQSIRADHWPTWAAPPLFETVTLTEAEVVLFAAASRATAVNVCAPFAIVFVSIVIA